MMHVGCKLGLSEKSGVALEVTLLPWLFFRDNDDSPVDIVAPKYFYKPGSLMVFP
jgi:hypothetical protein